MQKKVIILVSLALIVLFGIAVWQTVGRIGKTKVIVVVSPADSQVTLDGKKVKSGVLYVSSGKHSFAASRQFFDSNSETTNVSSEKTITLVLVANSSEGQAIIENTPGETERRQELVSTAAKNRGDQALETNPFISFLPVQNYVLGESYQIDYGPPSKGTNQPIILITAATPSLRQSALGYIKDLGYNPADMNLVFKNIATGFGTGDN